MRNTKFAFILLTLFLINSQASFAKKDTTIFYCNKELKKTSKKRAAYYAKVFQLKDGTFGFKQFDFRNNLYLTGSCLDKKMTHKQGAFIYYNLSGNKDKSGFYENNQATGEWKYFANNGTVLEIGNYKNNERSGEWNFFNDSGKKRKRVNYMKGKYDGNYLAWDNDTLIAQGQYRNDLKEGNWKYWYSNGTTDSEGTYFNNKRHNIWQFYFETGELSATEVYSNGEAIKIEWYDIEGTPVTPQEPLEQDPSFPGGNKAMSSFIAENINYPELAREMGEQGIIYISYTVEAGGTLSNFRIRKGVSMSLDQEALRVVKLMPKWIPGIDHGRNANTEFTIPIHFRLG